MEGPPPKPFTPPAIRGDFTASCDPRLDGVRTVILAGESLGDALCRHGDALERAREALRAEEALRSRGV